MSMLFKKNVYILLATFLWILLGIMVIGLVEKWIIFSAISKGEIPQGYFYVGEYGYIPPSATAAITLVFAALGVAFGFRWWKIIYVEKRRCLRWWK